MDENELDFKRIIKFSLGWLFSIIFLICFFYIVFTSLNVYVERKKGEAELARAESNRKIKILEAEATKESAKSLSDAEITRAHGVAQANEIIGNSLKGNESYLRYLWINGLQHNNAQTIYIPTEAGLPILEANPKIRTQPTER